MLEPHQSYDHCDLADAADTSALAALFPAAAPIRGKPEAVDLEMPGWIWGTMALCYGLFFGGLIAATGHDGEALFAIAISIGYAAMYFGTAAVLFGVDRPSRPSAFARGLAPLNTWSGPMTTPAAAAQVLIVPACLAIFGVGVAVIRQVGLGA